MRPAKIPFLPPKLDLTRLIPLIGKANSEVGNFNGSLRHIGRTASDLLINPLASKEAEASSHIEGTQATASDAFKSKIGEKIVPNDVRHILNYKLALFTGIEKFDSIPLSGRLLKEMHEVLVRGVRGQDRKPGGWRDQIVWIGPEGCGQEEATYVPPAPPEIPDLITDLEKFIQEDYLDPLVQAAIVHYQFEAIHPFFDGNGRIGRLFIPFFLFCKKSIDYPMLYVSSYFEKNRIDYYSYLNAVTQSGMWTEWVEFFLKGIIVSAQKGQENVKKLLDVKTKYYEIAQKSGMKYAHVFVDKLFENPFITTRSVMDDLKIPSIPTAVSLIRKFQEEGVLLDLDPGKKRKKTFVAFELHKIVEN